ncbi:helix-turn-helix transcriptional regulator [Zoogloea sp.]|uniref:helix-turn-helix transcriptional regulator n=1 Tax=Zoogloea sp. TaxID=49181 RepID=UPI0035B2A4A3
MVTQQPVSPAPIVILRRREVEDRTGLRCSTIYEGIKARTFPAPVRLGPRSVGWLESEINNWLAARIAARDSSVEAKSGRVQEGGRR